MMQYRPQEKQPARGKFFFGVGLFAAVTVLLWALVNFALVDDVHSYTRIMMQELYESEENIDVLLLGPSHCYRSVDAAEMSRLLEKNTFNAGTSQQLPDGAYYLLREALKTNQPKTVFLESFYVNNLQQKSADVPAAAYVITDFMKPGTAKFEYLWKMGGLAAFLDDLVPARHDTISPGEVLSTWRAKLTDGYAPGNWAYVNYPEEEYRGKGFVFTKTATGPDTDFSPIAQVDAQKPISDFSMEYLKKIAALCRENGIRLVLFTAPVPDAYLREVQDYQAYVDAVRALGQTEGFTYWDFNLSRETSQYGYEDFSDAHHLSGLGAEKFTVQLCAAETAFRSGENAEFLFYETYAEKLAENPDMTHKRP